MKTFNDAPTIIFVSHMIFAGKNDVVDVFFLQLGMYGDSMSFAIIKINTDEVTSSPVDARAIKFCEDAHAYVLLAQEQTKVLQVLASGNFGDVHGNAFFVGADEFGIEDGDLHQFSLLWRLSFSVSIINFGTNSPMPTLRLCSLKPFFSHFSLKLAQFKAYSVTSPR